jgi:hypothetical protein
LIGTCTTCCHFSLPQNTKATRATTGAPTMRSYSLARLSFIAALIPLSATWARPTEDVPTAEPEYIAKAKTAAPPSVVNNAKLSSRSDCQGSDAALRDVPREAKRTPDDPGAHAGSAHSVSVNSAAVPETGGAAGFSLLSVRYDCEGFHVCITIIARCSIKRLTRNPQPLTCE